MLALEPAEIAVDRKDRCALGVGLIKDVSELRAIVNDTWSPRASKLTHFKRRDDLIGINVCPKRKGATGQLLDLLSSELVADIRTAREEEDWDIGHPTMNSRGGDHRGTHQQRATLAELATFEIAVADRVAVLPDDRDSSQDIEQPGSRHSNPASRKIVQPFRLCFLLHLLRTRNNKGLDSQQPGGPAQSLLRPSDR